MHKQPQASRVLERRDVYRSKWLGVKFVDYEIGGRRLNNYEMVFRPTTEDKKLEIDGVDVIPIIKHKDKPTQLILIANFRPPVGKFVLEFPAGLMDVGSLEVTFIGMQENAQREVKEQTGYTVSHFVKFPAPGIYADPWKSNEQTKTLLAIIDGDANEKPEQQLESEQNIVVHLLTLDNKLTEQLLQLCKEHDYEVEAKLWTFAIGLGILSLNL